ncbi:MAG: asparaginase [Balneolaceae bacterium]|nr:asparaginase [Balneolaceae bacterium]
MKNILLIQTGGTIAMDIGAGQTPGLDPERWEELIYREIPELEEIASLHPEKLFFEDSSDVSPLHWDRLISRIGERYEDFDGFVILHGTDTMAYTASALSFGLRNLGKPVILTGSQVPMRNIRSDARRNLVNAIEMATLPFNEVGICFNDFLFRGNRATKMSIGDFDAFASPNFPPLAEIGLNIERNVEPPQPAGDFEAAPGFDDRVLLLKIFPGLSQRHLEALPLEEVQALVIESFGSGNFPLKEPYSLLPFLQRCLDRGILLVITSQAAYDAVDLSKYESGRRAQEMGVLGAGDMTTEATLTKIMYLLEQTGSVEATRGRFPQSLAGEVSAAGGSRPDRSGTRVKTD